MLNLTLNISLLTWLLPIGISEPGCARGLLFAYPSTPQGPLCCQEILMHADRSDGGEIAVRIGAHDARIRRGSLDALATARLWGQLPGQLRFALDGKYLYSRRVLVCRHDKADTLHQPDP